MYNLTEIAGNSTSIVGFFQGVNDTLMFGWFGTIFLIVFFLILLMSFYFSTQDIPKSLSGASFLVFVLAVFLKALNMIDGLALYITLIAAGATIAFAWKSR